MRHLNWISVCALLVISGCATKRSVQAQETPAATTQPSDPSLWTLEQIEPRPQLPMPTTQPTTRPSLDALQLYAQARAAQLRGDRFLALSLLERALELDPNSFDLNYALGQTHLGAGSGHELAIQALERAAAIQPDHLDVHLLLGRQHLARGNLDQALKHLRLAMQTSDYKVHPESAALVDLFLARTLQQKGYDRAAADQYEQLVQRLHQRLNVRGNPELYYLVSRPEAIYVHIGQLHEKRGRYTEALKYYRLAADQEPNNFDYQSHVAHALLGLGQVEEARKLATELARTHRASRDSVELLKKVYQDAGGDEAVIDALRRIQRDRPADRSIVFALADVLHASGKHAQAEQLLYTTWQRMHGDPIIATRLFELYTQRSATEAAARLVIETLARYPDLLPQVEPMWAKLVRPAARNRLRLPMLRQLEVSPQALAAKAYLTAKLAQMWGRDTLMRSSLQEAAAARPPFAPAYRDLLEDLLDRDQWNQEQKIDAAGKLITQLKQQNHPGLAAELEGLLALYQKRFSQAEELLENAIDLGNKGPAVEYALAAAFLEQGKDLQAESLLWKIIDEWSAYDQAYLALFRHYVKKGNRRAGEQALKVLQSWLAADPFSTTARLLQINVLKQGGRSDLAEATLLNLFRDQPDDPSVLAEMHRFYMRANRLEELINKLEEQRAKQPDNRMVVEMLVSLYMDHDRTADAVSAVDAMRTAVADDADQLYFVAHLYERVHQPQMTEKLLQEVLKLEPHSGASNDLGYMWADEGRNLEQAETLIRMAVRAEPDNFAYLDSLGWVLYKRGKFKEAYRYLAEAAESTQRPDPVVLDHLGDVLYRLDQPQEAAKVWRRSLDRLSELRQDRADLKKLQLQLQQKLQQHEAGQPVDVAPFAETETETVQAKMQ